MSGRFDVAILGGGCAGLSLATRLAEAPGVLRRVVVLEGRAAYTRDRTWCGWSLTPHPFQGLVSRSWRSWEVRSRGRIVTRSSAAHPYEHLRSDDFYADAIARIAGSAAVTLETGTRVVSVQASADGREHSIETSRGALRASLVVDARPSSARLEPDGLVQSFVGCEAPDPLDTEAATLMDFDVPALPGSAHAVAQDEVAFVYRLPLGDGRALVEATSFAPRAVPDDVHRARLDAYLARHGVSRGAGFEERGAIPMAPTRATTAADSGVVRVGTAGGAVKPSSGYAFHAIQRTTDALAGELRAGRRPAGSPGARATVDAWLDRVFLRFLRDHPERGPEVFVRLFEKVDPDALVRFLMEQPRVADRLRVMRAMPTAPLARAALPRRSA